MVDETNDAKALNAATDVIKVTLTLATGTLVFSAGLLKENITFSLATKWLLVFSWCALSVSIVAGAVAYSRVPVMIAVGKPDIEDKFFERPGQIHHIAFLLGVVALGVAMILILGGMTKNNSQKGKAQASANRNSAAKILKLQWEGPVTESYCNGIQGGHFRAGGRCP